MEENQLAAQIATKHNIFPQMVPYNMSWIFLVLMGIDPGVSCLGGKIVIHNTMDAGIYQYQFMILDFGRDLENIY